MCVALAAVAPPAPAQSDGPGLKGDGVEDAAPILQALVDSGAGAIRLPRGIHRLSRTVTVDLDKTGFTAFEGGGTSRLVMAGPGPALRFQGTHAGSADPASVQPGVWERQRMPLVDGLEIVGAHPEADGIEATGTLQLTISRSTVRQCRHGIRLVDRNRNVIISDCHIYENRGIGVFYDNVNLHQSNIVGSHISYCRGGGVVSRGGNVRNLQIGTCDIECNMGPDDPPAANVWLDSTGGSIGEVAITGCTIQHSGKAPGGANIRIEGGGDDPSPARREGRSTTREGNVTIGHNVFSDVQINLHIRNARGITVTGNTFWAGYERDLLVEDSAHVVIASNNFDRNPRYLLSGAVESESNGLLFTRCETCVINGNIVSGVSRHPAAVHLKECSRFLVTGNTILDSDGSGLLLENTRRSLVSNNVIRDDRPADIRSSEPSIRVLGNAENTLGSNALGNRQEVKN